MKLKIKTLLTVIFLMSYIKSHHTELPQNKPVNVVFDLGGVVVQTRQFTAMRHIGFFNLLSYGRDPRTLYFNYLDCLVKKVPYQYNVCDERGNRLPQLMCNWMLGTQSGKEISTFVKKSLATNKKLNSTLVSIFTELTDLIFNDEQKFLSTKKIVKETAAFIKECKAAGFGVYVLSNWDRESFELFKTMHSDLFDLFDGIIISADVHLLKPDPQIYQLLLDRFNLDPKTVVFVDDQIENIRAARKQGIFSIMCPPKKRLFSKKPNIAHVRHIFYHWLNGAMVYPTM